MMRGEQDRKGLSPLIATVLLIAFAVALGTMIMNWTFGGGGSASIEELCQETRIQLVPNPSNQGICFDAMSKHIKFTIKYLGPESLPYVIVQASDGQQQDSFQRYIEAELARGEQGAFVLAYDAQSASGVSAFISPVVIVDEKQHVCIEQELQQIGVPLC